MRSGEQRKGNLAFYFKGEFIKLLFKFWDFKAEVLNYSIVYLSVQMYIHKLLGLCAFFTEQVEMFSSNVPSY